MMVGTVTVVIHDTLFTVTTTVVLGASVDGAAGTDVVISVQKGITVTARQRRGDSHRCVGVNSRIFGSINCVYRSFRTEPIIEKHARFPEQITKTTAARVCGNNGSGAEVFLCRKR